MDHQIDLCDAVAKLQHKSDLLPNNAVHMGKNFLTLSQFYFSFIGVSPKRMEGVLVELLLSLALAKLPARQFILEMFLTIIVKSEK
jgi:hypothetical protein